MVRFKTLPLKYDSAQDIFRERPELAERGGRESQDDRRNKREDREPATNEVGIDRSSLVCCLNTWRGVRFSCGDQNDRESTGANALLSNETIHLVEFAELDSNRSRCAFKLFSGLEPEPNSIVGESSVLYSSLTPRVPYSDIRKSLMLLQRGGFICFLGEAVSVKRVRSQKPSGDKETGARENRHELLLVVDVHIYLRSNSLNTRLLSRTGGARGSMKVLLGWLDPDYVLPGPQGGVARPGSRSASRGGKKRESLDSIKNDSESQTAQIKPEELYSVFKEYDISSKRLGSLTPWEQPLGLVSELRSYQKDAVLFARRIENGVKVQFEYPPYWHVFTPQQTDCFLRSTTVSRFYANMLDGEISLDTPAGGGTFEVKGGFLCDEMGLGKSLEVISLILVNKRKERFQAGDPNSVGLGATLAREGFECPCGVGETFGGGLSVERCQVCGTRFHRECCLSERDCSDAEGSVCCCICENTILDRISVGATLIISPASIVDQWHDEISKHVEKGMLRVTKYNGVRYIQNNLLKKGLGFRSSKGGNCDRDKSKDNTESEDLTGNSDLSVLGNDADDIYLKHGYGRHIKTRRDICDYDVVITSYEVLKEEIYHVMEREDILNKRSMRYKKSYPVLPSLLVNVSWWRIVLDEAQMTEGYSLVSKMTGKLTCSHKWCVTGTPIVRSCSNDLFGLMSNLSNVGFPFVGESSNSSLFRKYVGSLSCSIVLNKGPRKGDSMNGLKSLEEEGIQKDSGRPKESGLTQVTERYRAVYNLVSVLERLVGLVFYRREMRQVEEELNIPRPFYGNTMLSLSSVERFFYVKQCEMGLSSFESTVSKLTGPSDTLIYNKKDVDSIITMLRLACIHPQLGSMGLSQGVRSGGSLVRYPNGIEETSGDGIDVMKSDTLTSSLNSGLRIMTMDQILDKLLNKCRIEIEESVRKYVMNTLGLAGLHVYKKETEKAVSYYNQVIDIRNEDRVDILQQIHALWNLVQVSKMAESSIGPDVEKLSIECERLEYRYKNKYIKEYRDKFELYLKSKEKTDGNDYKKIMDGWWHVFRKNDSLSDSGGCVHGQQSLSCDEDALVDKINDFLYEYRSSRDGDSTSQLPEITSVPGLLVLLDIKIRDIEEKRKSITVEMEKLRLLKEDIRPCKGQEVEGGECEDSDMGLLLDSRLLDQVISKVYSCGYCRGPESANPGLELGFKWDRKKADGNTDESESKDLCDLCSLQTHFELLERCLYTLKKRPKGRAKVEDQRPTFDSTFLRDSETVALVKLMSKEVRRGAKTEFKKKDGDDLPVDYYEATCDSQEGQRLNRAHRACSSHIKFLELIKSELNHSKSCVSSIRQLVNSYLELNDCKQRIQVVDVDIGAKSVGRRGVPIDGNSSIYSDEVFYYTEKYELERLSALGSRRNLKSQQKFLCSLKLSQRLGRTGGSEEGRDPAAEFETCPICLGRVSNDYSQVLLPCAHLLCIECYRAVKKSNRVKNLCPKCRCAFSDTSVVLIVPDCQRVDNGCFPDDSGSHEERRGTRADLLRGDHHQFSGKRIRLVGNFGTKIQAVIGHIKWIIGHSEHENSSQSERLQDRHSTADVTEKMERGSEAARSLGMNIGEQDKILVFSDFQQVLDIISEALALNNVAFRKYNGGKSEYNVLREFQNGEDIRVLVCNSLHVGKGVNITSANHVVFVSPLVNKSDELQAIGRIMRMGQKKTPHIWNFVVDNSIDRLLFDDYSLKSDADKEQHIYVKIANHMVQTSRSVSKFVSPTLEAVTPSEH